MSVFGASDTNLALPLSMKPTSNISRRPHRAERLEIPLWEKPSCASNINDYVAIIPLHHGEATKYLAKQRELVLQRPAAEAGGEANSMHSTIADDISDGSSSNESDLADFASPEGLVESERAHKSECNVERSNESNLADFASPQGLAESDLVDKSSCLAFGRNAEDFWSAAQTMSQVSRRQALVGSLRAARQQAHARRIALRSEADCKSEVVIDDGAKLSKMELVAALRDARGKAASQRMCVSIDTPKAATVAATFAVTIVVLNGSHRNIYGLHSHMVVEELVELVASAFQMPNFAVRLLWKAEILHMSQPATPLHVLGIEEGVQLTLVKNFGWAKPDVIKLHDLGMFNGAKTSAARSLVDCGLINSHLRQAL